MNWFPVIVTLAAAGMPLLGMKYPGLALSMLVFLGSAAIVWMARELWIGLRSSRELSPVAVRNANLEQASAEGQANWNEEPAA